ncbi:MAG: DUF3137 domain-containing protein [Rhodospirillales bacterium]|nr:DUF3137 domain-containing protein [Rhodospirillales bacterium]
MSDDLLATLELRRRADRNFFLGCVLSSLLVLGFLATFLPPLWLLFSGMILTLLNLNAYYILRRHFKRKGKALFLTSIAKEFGLTYSPSHAFEIGKLLDHGIIPPYDLKETEDGFKKNDRSFPIAFQEVILKKIEQDEREQKRYIKPVFRGLMIKLTLKRRLDFHTIIIPNRFLRPTVEAGSIPHYAGFEEVKLISPHFTKDYKVYSTNQIESRVLFDPLFIERFLELGTHLNAKWLEASFYRNELLIMAQFTKDHFEIGSILRPVLEDDLQQVRQEISHIMKLSEMLKHNAYIGE